MSDKSNDIVITAALRTPIGTYNGSLKNLSADKLGTVAIKEVIHKSKLKPEDIDEVIFGQVLTSASGQNPARQASINAGIYLAPEDRKRTGLVTEFDITKNISLASLQKYSNKLGLIDNNAEDTVAKTQVESLNIKTPSTRTPVINLSGGNQQKVVLGKWLSMEPKAIIFDEPTRGIDVGAKAEIYKLMRNLANQGVAVWMISSDMEEVLGISDRITVMHEGNITGEIKRENFSEEAIMHLAVGGKNE
mgnify:CR=1 FL=1